MLLDRRRALTLAAAAAALAAGSVTLAQAQDKAVRIGVSSVGSVLYTLGVGLSKLIQQHEKIAATAEPVGGSVANIFALRADKIEFALTNATAALDGYYGAGRFKGKPVKFGLLSLGQPSYRQLVVRVGSGIDKPEDLKGKTIIGKRPALPEIEEITRAILKHYKVDPAMVKIVATTETGEVVDALKAGTVDAAIIPASANASYMKQLTRENKIKFLYMPDDKVNAMLADVHSAISIGQLPAKMYDGQDKPVNVFDIPIYFIADSRVSEDTAYKMMRALYDHYDEFKTFHSTARTWTIENTLKDPKIPFHPGAVRYLKEKGKWTPALEKKQATLLAQK
jgi:TRAP transporter TAXI family solute receptor